MGEEVVAKMSDKKKHLIVLAVVTTLIIVGSTLGHKYPSIDHASHGLIIAALLARQLVG